MQKGIVSADYITGEAPLSRLNHVLQHMLDRERHQDRHYSRSLTYLEFDQVRGKLAGSQDFVCSGLIGWQLQTARFRPFRWDELLPEYAFLRAPSLAEARAYCERLANTHYENFSVVTWFLPARLHQHFYNVYAYCRISDDLGDEVGNPQHSLELMDQWETELEACYCRVLRSIRCLWPWRRRCAVRYPEDAFSDLLKAFRQDQTVRRFATFDDLRGYCRYSAIRSDIWYFTCADIATTNDSSFPTYTCTALQLANFWQDVFVDYGKNRIYLPLEDLRRFGVTEQQIAERRCTPGFIDLMKFEVQRAREWFDRGLPLAGKLEKELAIDIELFCRGGQEILNAIEAPGI